MRYLPDSNVFITTLGNRNSITSISFGLKHSSPNDTLDWIRQWFMLGFERGVLVSANEVFDDLRSKKDRVYHFLLDLRNRGLIEIVKPEEETDDYIREIHQFVQRCFTTEEAHEFLTSTDIYLLALAKTHDLTLITLESHVIPQANLRTRKIQGKVRIPYVAWVFGVRCVPIYVAFREIGMSNPTQSREVSLEAG